MSYVQDSSAVWLPQAAGTHQGPLVHGYHHQHMPPDVVPYYSTPQRSWSTMPHRGIHGKPTKHSSSIDSGLSMDSNPKDYHGDSMANVKRSATVKGRSSRHFSQNAISLRRMICPALKWKGGNTLTVQKIAVPKNLSRSLFWSQRAPVKKLNSAICKRRFAWKWSDFNETSPLFSYDHWRQRHESCGQVPKSAAINLRRGAPRLRVCIQGPISLEHF